MDEETTSNNEEPTQSSTPDVFDQMRMIEREYMARQAALGPMAAGIPGLPSITLTIRAASNGFIIEDANRYPRREIICADADAVLDNLRQELPRLTG